MALKSNILTLILDRRGESGAFLLHGNGTIILNCYYGRTVVRRKVTKAFPGLISSIPKGKKLKLKIRFVEDYNGEYANNPTFWLRSEPVYVWKPLRLSATDERVGTFSSCCIRTNDFDAWVSANGITALKMVIVRKYFVKA